MNRRTIIIGDVHGCIDELNDLAAKLNFRPGDDRIIFVGDLIQKGPDSKSVWTRFKELGAESVLGNKEHDLVEQVDRVQPASRHFANVMSEFDGQFESLIRALRTWPYIIEEDEFMVVHGGLVPGKNLSGMSPEDLVTIRTWDGRGLDTQNMSNPPWFDFYDGDKLVVFGHWASLGGVVRDRVIGLDTGCVYGGHLSALILPERKIVSVPARKTYCPIGRGGE